MSFTHQFTSPLQFAEHLLALDLAWRKERKHALDRALTVIEKAAVAEIGEYQAAAGPYPAWAPLAESTEAEKARLGYPTDAPLLREGDFAKSFQHEATSDEGIVGSTSKIAPFHEYGTSKMPPRPVLGPAVFHSKKKVEEVLGRALVEVLTTGSVGALALKEEA